MSTLQSYNHSYLQLFYIHGYPYFIPVTTNGIPKNTVIAKEETEVGQNRDQLSNMSNLKDYFIDGRHLF